MLAGFRVRGRILQHSHFPHHLVEGSGWRSGRPLVQYPARSSGWRKYLLNFRKQVGYPPRVFYEDGDGLFGGFRVSFFPQLIVQLGFGRHFSRMSHEFPDLAEDRRLFCVVLPDFLVLLPNSAAMDATCACRCALSALARSNSLFTSSNSCREVVLLVISRMMFPGSHPPNTALAPLVMYSSR